MLSLVSRVAYVDISTQCSERSLDRIAHRKKVFTNLQWYCIDIVVTLCCLKKTYMFYIHINHKC